MSSVGQEARSVWRQVAVVIDGKDIPVGRATLLTVTPDGYEVTVNGRIAMPPTDANGYTQATVVLPYNQSVGGVAAHVTATYEGQVADADAVIR